MKPGFKNPRLLVVVGVLVALGVIADVIIGYSPFPGYGALIGLGGCIALVFASKWLGKVLLERGEDYYPDDIPDEVQEDVRD